MIELPVRLLSTLLVLGALGSGATWGLLWSLVRARRGAWGVAWLSEPWLSTRGLSGEDGTALSSRG